MFPLCSGQEGTSIPRRALLVGGFSGAVSCAFPRMPHAATAIVLPTAAGNRRFSVLYKGDRIGAHTVSYSSATGETRVNTEIHLLVKIAFFTVFAFSHRSEETWRAGRLMSLNSETVEHGETLLVEGAAMPQGFRVVSKGGPFIASAATLTSNSLWTPAMKRSARFRQSWQSWCRIPQSFRHSFAVLGPWCDRRRAGARRAVDHQGMVFRAAQCAGRQGPLPI
jgi:hypothetical protein